MRKYSLKKEIVITCVTICVLVFMLVFISYSDFYGNMALLDKVGLNYRNVSDNSNIYLDSTSIMSNEDAMRQGFYNISLYNKEKRLINYNIYLMVDKTVSNDAKVNLKCVHYSINEKMGMIDEATDNNYIIYSGSLKDLEKDNVMLKVWIDEECTKVENKTAFKIYVDYVYEDNFLNYLKTIVSNMDEYYIDTDQALGLYKINDSSRYIGSVANNYVYFNCTDKNLSSCEVWRIVGIEKVPLKNGIEERVKIVRGNVLDDLSRYNEDYFIKSSLIESFMRNEEGGSYETNMTYLTLMDYKNTFNYGVDEDCFSDIFKCNNASSSYLYTGMDEWLAWDGKYLAITKQGSVVQISKDSKKYQRPVVYLKEDVKLVGGNGSKDMPYIIK